ncbi:ATPase [Moraxella sp. K02]
MSMQALKQYIEQTGISQSKVATLLGVSTATVSQYLKGTYNGDVEGVDKKVVEMLDRQADKAKDVKSDFVETPTAKDIFDVCAMAHSMADINLVIGEAGLGKTVTLKQYAKTVDNVILVEVTPTYSPKVMLVELCNRLGIVPSRSNHDNEVSIVEKLKGSDKLLIIDEAELLAYKSLEIIRRIHDMAKIGVVLAGMPRLRANLHGKEGEYKQLYSRIGFVGDLSDRLPEQDIGMLSQATIGTDAFNAKLYEACHGNARRLNKLLRGVNRLSKLNNRPIDEAMINKFTQMLID